MARCCGGSGTCACKVQEGRHVSVTGTGTSQDPFVIAAQTHIDVLDTDQFNLAIYGEGTLASPWVLAVNYANGASLNGVPDVAADGVTNGQVLSWDAVNSRWIPTAPLTAGTPGVTTKNLVLNPSFEVNTTGWTGINATLGRAATAAHGLISLSIAASAAGAAGARTASGTGGMPVTGNTAYAVQAKFRAPATPRNCTVAITWVDSAGADISTATSPAVSDVLDAFTKVTHSATSPANAVYAYITVTVLDAAASEVHWVDGAMFEKGSVASPYGDGSTPGWDWTGTANLSASGPVVGVAKGNGLTGDGSPSSPLAVAGDAARFIAVSTNGVGLSDAGLNRLVRVFADATARGNANPAPVAGTLSILQTNPSQIDYFDGVTWLPVTGGVGRDAVGQFLARSGNYTGGAITMFVRQMSVVTDATGAFVALSATDLAAYAGVLSCKVIPTGTGTAWAPMVAPGTGIVTCVARRVSDGNPHAGVTVTATVEATLY